jgi:hypothetical protein
MMIFHKYIILCFETTWKALRSSGLPLFYRNKQQHQQTQETTEQQSFDYVWSAISTVRCHASENELVGSSIPGWGRQQQGRW